MRKIMTVFTLLVMMSSLVVAHGDALAEGEEIVEQKIPCEELTEEQLEAVGDYYMEQMHPGEAHVRMDEMMGGEGSESLRQMHINMARSFYCGDHEAMGPGMMNQMMDGPQAYDNMPMHRPYSQSSTPWLLIILGLAAGFAYWVWDRNQ